MTADYLCGPVSVHPTDRGPLSVAPVVVDGPFEPELAITVTAADCWSVYYRDEVVSLSAGLYDATDVLGCPWIRGRARWRRRPCAAGCHLRDIRHSTCLLWTGGELTGVWAEWPRRAGSAPRVAVELADRVWRLHPDAAVSLAAALANAARQSTTQVTS